MSRLNYHHLYYFWRVARDGRLTRTAEALHVSQSALSAQIRQLEDSVGHTLFERVGRSLQLTEMGQRVLLYANEIFRKGEELESLLRGSDAALLQTLEIGVVSTLSRNFVDAFLAPLLTDSTVRLNLHSARLADLLNRLASHQLDLVLCNVSVTGDDGLWQNRLLARQPVAIVGPAPAPKRTRFPGSLGKHRWLLPGRGSEVRSAFDALCSQHGFEPDVLAEVEDMALLRLLTRDSGALAVMPPVVVRDEIRRGELAVYLQLPGVFEHFYAITVTKQYAPRALNTLLVAAAEGLLEV